MLSYISAGLEKLQQKNRPHMASEKENKTIYSTSVTDFLISIVVIISDNNKNRSVALVKNIFRFINLSSYVNDQDLRYFFE